MDKSITDILQEAAEEAYEDDFATDNDASDYNPSAASPLPQESRNSPVQSIAASLQSAARAIDAEDAQEARERLVDTAAEIQQSIEPVAPQRPAEPKSDNPRSRTVHSVESDDIGEALTRADEAIAQKYQEMPRSPDVSEAEDEEEVGDFDIDTEIISLCYHNRIDEITRRLRKGASILCLDPHGWTTLHWAAAHNKVELLEYLLHDTPAGNTRSYLNHKEKIAGFTPLHVGDDSYVICVFML